MSWKKSLASFLLRYVAEPAVSSAVDSLDAPTPTPKAKVRRRTLEQIYADECQALEVMKAQNRSNDPAEAALQDIRLRKQMAKVAQYAARLEEAQSK